MARGVKGSTVMAACGHCGGPVPAHLGYRFCSFRCRCAGSQAKVTRSCKTCSRPFEVYASNLRVSNTSGNFCSRPCYATWLRTPAARQPRGGRNWSRRAREAREFAPFCAMCGTLSGQLEAHHLLPRRHGGSDDQSNLITLCFSHHRLVEAQTRAIVKACPHVPPAQLLAPLAGMLRFRQEATFHRLLKIARTTR